MKSILILLSFFSCFAALDASDSLYVKFGIFGDYSLNFYNADFKRLPDCPSCSPGYLSGSGKGYAFAALFEYPLSKLLTLGIRGTYYDFSGTLKRTETTTIIVNGNPTVGAFEHTIAATMKSIGFEPMVKISPFNSFYVDVGIHSSFVTTKNYSQLEQIVQPPDVGTFIDSNGVDTKSRTRNAFSGTLQKAASMHFALFGGISYELPLDKAKRYLIEPEIFYFYGLNNIVSDPLVTTWKANSLRMGIALKYSPIPAPKKSIENKEEYRIDTLKIESENIAENKFISGKAFSKTETEETDNKIINFTTISRTDTILYPKLYKFDLNVAVVGVDTLGKEIPNPMFTVEEFISNRLDPLLNYVFFDNNSAKIPSRYTSFVPPVVDNFYPPKVNSFEIDSLYKLSTMEIYYNLLNIIGKRMKTYPEAKITLTGCNSDIDEEKGNTALSKSRAEAVRDYFVNVWGIESGRIRIKTRNLPEKASTPSNEPDKIVENRRVEIVADEPKITEPVFTTSIERKASPEIARFKIKSEAEAGIKNWTFEASQKNTLQKDQFQSSGTSIVPKQIDWRLDSIQNLAPEKPEPLFFKITATDGKNREKSAIGQTQAINLISVQKKKAERIGDYEFERFSLILFDFDKSTITGANKDIIDFVLNHIKPESEIEICGYTDRTGNEEHNKKLSENRASSTKVALKRTDAKDFGVGSEKLLYDNELPEGRFYCRTVVITVKTPIK